MKNMKTKKKVSIVTALYHGSVYLPRLQDMIESNANDSEAIANLEWVVVNDDPEEIIRPICSNDFDATVVNHKKNIGVQGSRIEGIEACNGEYIVMLDQDDLIMTNYISSQLKRIGKADAVICHVKQEGVDIYKKEYRFDDLFVRERYLLSGNNIVSPGQVLLKKSSIPTEWKRNLLKNSGADDYMLWLLMYSHNAHFVPNNDLVFERVINMKNNSFNLEKLYLSELEVIDFAIKNSIFQENELNLLKDYRNHFIKKELNQYSKFLYIISVINRIMSTDNGAKFAKKILAEKGDAHIAIYGGGTLCKTIVMVLKCYGIKVECVVDKEYDSIDMQVPVVSPESIPENIGVVLITVYNEAERIKNYIQTNYKEKKVLFVSDLF